MFSHLAIYELCLIWVLLATSFWCSVELWDDFKTEGEKGWEIFFSTLGIICFWPIIFIPLELIWRLVAPWCK